MSEQKEYRVISGNSLAELQKELTSASFDHWRPILLSSAAAGLTAGSVFLHVAILERNTVG